MKNLFLFLFLFVSNISICQTDKENFDLWYVKNRNSVEMEFVRMMDSARNDLKVSHEYYISTEYKEYNYIQLKKLEKEEIKKGNKTFLTRTTTEKKYYYLMVTKKERVSHMIYDSIHSLPSKHHAEFLMELGENGIITHNEYNVINGYKYKGDLEPLAFPVDRIKYYSSITGQKMSFNGECLIWSNYDNLMSKTNIYNKNFWSEENTQIAIFYVASHMFESFKKSKPHWKIFMTCADIKTMGVFFNYNPKTKFITFVSLV